MCKSPSETLFWVVFNVGMWACSASVVYDTLTYSKRMDAVEKATELRIAERDKAKTEELIQLCKNQMEGLNERKKPKRELKGGAT